LIREDEYEGQMGKPNMREGEQRGNGKQVR